jgi:hypothetical protein
VPTQNLSYFLFCILDFEFVKSFYASKAHYKSIRCYEGDKSKSCQSFYVGEGQVIYRVIFVLGLCRNPILRQVWGWDSHSQNGNLESSGTPKLSKFDCRGQNTSPWIVLYIVGKVLKCRWRKWPRMSHLNIYSISYGQKKGRESDWQFDSWPLKVGNRPDPGVCRWSATHCWKDFEESYKFVLNFIPIRGLSWELWAPKVPGVQFVTVLGLLLGTPGTKSHSDAGAVEQRKEYYMGEGGGFPWVRAVVSQVSLCCLWLVPT